jgi:hypothetical protein
MAPAAAPAPVFSAPVSGPIVAPEPESLLTDENPELEQLDTPSRRRRGGTPVVRILLGVLISAFLTVPLVLLGVYTYASFKSWNKKPKVARTKVVEAVKKPEYVIPDNIDWDRPQWSKFGEWSGTGKLYKNSQTDPSKLISIKVVRPRLRIVMDGSRSRGAKKPETANFRMINVDDSSIQSLVGGFTVPGKFEYDSYEHAKRKGVPLGTYNLQVETQGNPSWHVVAYEDLQFPDGSEFAAPKK